MEENKRLYALRKELGLTMEKFGARIGLSKQTVSALEAGDRMPTDQTIMLICREFNVRPEWLLDGSGEMFHAMTKDEQIAAFVARTLGDESAEFQRAFLSVLATFGPHEWDLLAQAAVQLAAAAPEERRPE